METKPNPDYDFNTPIENTSTDLAKMILTKLEASKDTLVIASYEKLDPVTKAAFVEKSTDFSIDILNEIAKSDIPADYAATCVTKLMVVLESLKGFIEGTINQRTDELMARTIGVKSPMSGRYAQECATVGQILLRLDDVRQSQGNVKSDYFTSKPEAAEVVGGSSSEDETDNVELSTGDSTETEVADTKSE